MDSAHSVNPLDSMPLEYLLKWCDDHAVTRYTAMARVITCHESETAGSPHWTRVAIRFLDRAVHAIQRLEWLQRPRPEPELGVVVVLDDQAVAEDDLAPHTIEDAVAPLVTPPAAQADVPLANVFEEEPLSLETAELTELPPLPVSLLTSERRAMTHRLRLLREALRAALRAATD